MEEWRPVPGHEGRLEVSNLGRILSYRRGPPRLLKLPLDKYGYAYFSVGRGRRLKVHRVVCEAFNGPCPPGRECGHLDGDKLNNVPSNLAWITRSENELHKFEHGVRQRKPRSPPRREKERKLSELQVRNILREAGAGRSGRSLAREYGITSANMSAIIRGDLWAYLHAEMARTE